jgi:23S rRNA (cytidine1920-2'-O)/16S rRNA (cytidine1409-2'-O)-methyltransferase
VRRGIAPSRSQAAELIARGVVLVGGAVADKASRLVAEADPVIVGPETPRFVSRGGLKLESALERWNVAVAGLRCLDAGASTGGFTDCLLQRGAAVVVSVDVGYGILHPSLRSDSRVVLLERTNVRNLDLASVGGEAFDLVVADLSFISLTAVVHVLAGELAKPGAGLVLLVKPQFEAGRAAASRGKGVVRDHAERLRALERVASALCSAGASIIGAMPSPLLGPSGNAEFFVRATARDASSVEEPRRDGGLDPSVKRMLDVAVSAAPDVSASASADQDAGGHSEGSSSKHPRKDPRQVGMRRVGDELSW